MGQTFTFRLASGYRLLNAEADHARMSHTCQKETSRSGVAELRVRMRFALRAADRLHPSVSDDEDVLGGQRQVLGERDDLDLLGCAGAVGIVVQRPGLLVIEDPVPAVVRRRPGMKEAAVEQCRLCDRTARTQRVEDGVLEPERVVRDVELGERPLPSLTPSAMRTKVPS